jgi:hypothetical protein
MAAEQTLRDVADAEDASAFVGRDAELVAIDDLLDPTTSSRILYVHGPGGIGKSAFLRAAARRVSIAGATPASLDARALPIDLDLLRARVLEAAATATVLIIDEADTLGSALPPLRDALLDSLPASARLVLAGRATPQPSWRDGGLHAIFRDLALAPLRADDADTLLRRRGVADKDRRAQLTQWAAGSPLALTVGASLLPAPASGDLGLELEQRLAEWLAGEPTLDIDPDVLAVAALTRTVDARLLTAALPGRSTREAFARLGDLRVTQRLAGGVTLHPVLAATIKARLKAESPAQYRALSARIVEHLGTRARLGDIEALLEMTLFIESEQLRAIVGMEASPTHYADRPRGGEIAQFALANGFDAVPGWDAMAQFATLPGGMDLVMRRNDGTAVLLEILRRVSDLPDTPLGRDLAAAAYAAGVNPDLSFAGIVMFADVPVADRAEATRISIGAFMRRHRAATMEAVIIHYPEPARRPEDAISLLAKHKDGPWEHEIFLSDFRPGGAVAFVEGAVFADLGVAPPDPSLAELLAADDDPLRQSRLVAVLDEVFGGAQDEARLRLAIELTHLTPRRSEQECRDTLHVSRATWFRMLREARERVLAFRA